MRNVTISLDEQLLRWAKVTAARQNKSLSKFIAHIVEGFKQSVPDESEFMSEFNTFQPRKISKQGERIFNREEVYERSRIR